MGVVCCKVRQGNEVDGGARGEGSQVMSPSPPPSLSFLLHPPTHPPAFVFPLKEKKTKTRNPHPLTCLVLCTPFFTFYEYLLGTNTRLPPPPPHTFNATLPQSLTLTVGETQKKERKRKEEKKPPREKKVRKFSHALTDRETLSRAEHIFCLSLLFSPHRPPRPHPKPWKENGGKE